MLKSCLEFPFQFAASTSMHVPCSCCCLTTLSFLCTSAFSSSYRFLYLPFALFFSVIAAKASSDVRFFLLRLDGSNRFSGHLQQDCPGTFPEIFCGYLILCSLQCRNTVGHLCCFFLLEFLEIQRRNAVLSLSFSQPDFDDVADGSLLPTLALK